VENAIRILSYDPYVPRLEIPLLSPKVIMLLPKLIDQPSFLLLLFLITKAVVGRKHLGD
jgi:hypothetical protein